MAPVSLLGSTHKRQSSISQGPAGWPEYTDMENEKSSGCQSGLKFPPARIQPRGRIIQLPARAGHQLRLDELDGESPHWDRTVTREADYWIAVYSVLVDQHEAILNQAQELVLTGGGEIDFIQSALDTLKDRLAFWRIRRGQEWLGSQHD